MSDAIRLVLAGIVRDFVDGGATCSIRHFDVDDITIYDKPENCKSVLVTFEYTKSKDLDI